VKQMKKSSENKNNLITYGIVVAAFLFVCILIWTGNASRHLKAMLVPIGINIILAVSLNLIVGFLGELTLGHAGFMSVGAYAGCLFAIKYQDVLPTIIRFPLAMVIGGLVASVFGIIIGVPVLRLKGDYLAIVTLAFGEIIRSVIINLEFTGGAAGLKGTPQDTNIYIVFAVIMIMLVVIINLVNSRAGRAICSIRDNRIAAESIGINITYYKLLAFVVAAFFAGVAGVIYGHNLSILQASVFDYNRSIEILVIVVLGGMGSIRGSVIAATIITALPEMLRGADKFRMLIYAVVLIAMMLLNGSSRFDKYKGRMNIGGLFSLIKNKKSAKEAG